MPSYHLTTTANPLRTQPHSQSESVHNSGNKLLGQGIEVMRAQAGFVAANGMSYPEGSYVVSLAQPKMGLIRYLLGRTRYPDNEWTRNGDGSPKRPYDMATDTMFEFMGVRVDALDETGEADLQKVEGEIQPAGTVAAGTGGYSSPVRYVERDLLESGWLLGEETLANKAAMVVAAKGQGRVVMIGFRAQHRAQTHGTFKLVFNALIEQETVRSRATRRGNPGQKARGSNPSAFAFELRMMISTVDGGSLRMT